MSADANSLNDCTQMLYASTHPFIFWIGWNSVGALCAFFSFFFFILYDLQGGGMREFLTSYHMLMHFF